jgi:diadenosine tetraphosphatase ApaH/serine/threonine PP2A family protein phosphatase
MRALVLSDIHGNLKALEAVLGVAQSHTGGGFDELWNLGDMVGYGARPNEVIDTLRGLKTKRSIHVRGNHDRVCCGMSSSQGFNPIAALAAAWTRQQLRPENREWLRALPMGPIQVTEHVLCAHGSPLHEDQYISSMRDAWTPLQRMPAEIAFFGHTHLQGGFSLHAEDWSEDCPVYAARNRDSVEHFTMDLVAGSRYLINPGAVGQPRDGDWRAAFAIYDEAQAQVTFFRTPYDVAAAQARIREAHLPERLAARLNAGR